MPKISKRIVDATSPDPTHRIYVWDDLCKGFGLAVMPSGVRSYVFQYRVDGQSRRIKLGTHGSVTAEQARQLALDMAEKVRKGEDPLRQKQERQAALTVAQMLDAYVESEAFTSKGPATQAFDLGRVERHLKPLLGAMKADRVTARDVEKAMAAIRTGKTAVTVRTGKLRGLARVKGGPSAAINCAVLLRTCYRWAIREKLLKENPVSGVRIGSPGIRDTILDADGYRRLFETMKRLENEGRLRSAVIGAIAVIALTGARRGEIAGLRWRHIDIKTGQIVLQPSEHKSGRKTNRSRIIGLPAMAQTIIAKQPPGDDDDLVFRPARGDRKLALTKPWTIIRAEAKLPPGIGLHGLRHSVASHMAMSGASTVEMMTSLGHASVQHLTRYVHFAESSRQQLAEKAASVAIAAMQAASGSPSAEVVSITRKGR